MTYATYQQKLFGAKPVWLYEFTTDGVTTSFTSARNGYMYNSETYVNKKVRHSRVPQTTFSKRAEMNVYLPQSDTFAQSLRDDYGVSETKVVIRHGFEADPDQEFVVRFRGRVVSVSPKIGVIHITCENNVTALRRKALANVIQRPCRHALYHGDCGLSIASFETSATATDWTSPILTVTEAALQSDGYYNGGVVTFGTQRQLIRRHTGTQLKLLAPLAGVADEISGSGSASVSIAPGCDLTISTCKNRFNNSDDFGGFIWMDDSPFDGRNPY